MSDTREFTVEVHQIITVTLDASKFDAEFMADFRRNITDFNTLDEHAAHLGQLYARGLADRHRFIEGYGEAAGMGIDFAESSVEAEVLEA